MSHKVPGANYNVLCHLYQATLKVQDILLDSLLKTLPSAVTTISPHSIFIIAFRTTSAHHKCFTCGHLGR